MANTELYTLRAALQAETDKVRKLRDFHLTEYRHGASDTDLISWRARSNEIEGELKALHIAQGMVSKLISGIAL